MSIWQFFKTHEFVEYKIIESLNVLLDPNCNFMFNRFVNLKNVEYVLDLDTKLKI